MDSKVKKILGTGLSGGYGSSNYGKVTRASFGLDSSDYQGVEGKYHDEWAAHQNGGGQELIETPDGKKWTRVYAGGTPDEKSLIKIGLTSDDVNEKIKFYLGRLGTKSRLNENVESIDGDWKYSYRVKENIAEIPVIVGEERIEYKGGLVFIHFLINSPVV